MIAPAPIRSSKEGRKEPSDQRSPAGMMEIFLLSALANSATACAFLRQPAIVSVAPVDKLNLDPFGEGMTNFNPLGIFNMDCGRE